MAEYDAAVRGNAVDVIWRLEHFAGPTPQALNAALGLGWKDASRQALIMGASPHLDIPETLSSRATRAVRMSTSVTSNASPRSVSLRIKRLHQFFAGMVAVSLIERSSGES